MMAVSRNGNSWIKRASMVLIVTCGWWGAYHAAVAQEYTVNLKDTELEELIKFVAEVTGTTIIVDPQVKGKIKVISNQPIMDTPPADRVVQASGRPDASPPAISGESRRTL